MAESTAWFKRRAIVVYIFRHRNLGWICIPLLAWQQAQIGALGITIIILVGWMDGWQRSQSNIHQHPWEGGRKEGADITEGRLPRGEQRRGVISCDWGSSVKGKERQLLPHEVP